MVSRPRRKLHFHFIGNFISKNKFTHAQFIFRTKLIPLQQFKVLLIINYPCQPKKSFFTKLLSSLKFVQILLVFETDQINYLLAIIVFKRIKSYHGITKFSMGKFITLLVGYYTVASANPKRIMAGATLLNSFYGKMAFLTLINLPIKTFLEIISEIISELLANCCSTALLYFVWPRSTPNTILGFNFLNIVPSLVYYVSISIVFLILNSKYMGIRQTEKWKKLSYSLSKVLFFVGRSFVNLISSFLAPKLYVATYAIFILNAHKSKLILALQLELASNLFRFCLMAISLHFENPATLTKIAIYYGYFSFLKIPCSLAKVTNLHSLLITSVELINLLLLFLLFFVFLFSLLLLLFLFLCKMLSITLARADYYYEPVLFLNILPTVRKLGTTINWRGKLSPIRIKKHSQCTALLKSYITDRIPSLEVPIFTNIGYLQINFICSVEYTLLRIEIRPQLFPSLLLNCFLTYKFLISHWGFNYLSLYTKTHKGTVDALKFFKKAIITYTRPCYFSSTATRQSNQNQKQITLSNYTTASYLIRMVLTLTHMWFLIESHLTNVTLIHPRTIICFMFLEVQPVLNSDSVLTLTISTISTCERETRLTSISNHITHFKNWYIYKSTRTLKCSVAFYCIIIFELEYKQSIIRPSPPDFKLATWLIFQPRVPVKFPIGLEELSVIKKWPPSCALYLIFGTSLIDSRLPRLLTFKNNTLDKSKFNRFTLLITTKFSILKRGEEDTPIYTNGS